MGKLLRLRDYILISAALGGELFEEVRLVGGFLPSAIQNQYGFVPSKYKKNSYLTEVSEMLSTGDIERNVSKEGKVYLILTSSGKKKFKRKFRIFYKSHKWDGYFMIVSFDIPEKVRKVRDTIRRKLQELGFGMLQESVWISPYHFEEDLREFLEIHNLGQYAFVLSAKKILAGEVKSLTAKVWKLKELNKNYDQVIKIIRSAIKGGSTKRKEIITKAHELYLETLSKDPLLPKELLPNYWVREKALKALDKYFSLNF